ncbi:MAG: hypothetical protein ACLFSC_06560 [Wenzhouxiangella sp.]
MRTAVFCVGLVLLLGACGSLPPQPSDSESVTQRGGSTEVIDVILDAADSFTGITATAVFVVRGVGERGEADQRVWYLNSERDYRDFRSLNVAISPTVAKQLQEAEGIETVHELLGRSIRVRGVARRVPIYFFCQGRQTESYYYQTQLPIIDREQIQILSAP